MAESKRITRQSLLHDENDRRSRYSGTKAQLIATGLGTDGDFPGDPGGPVTSRTIKLKDGRRWHISEHSRLANPRTFWVTIKKEAMKDTRKVTDRCARARARPRTPPPARRPADADELPDYVIERNRAALAAGLAVERQEFIGDRLTTWYRGTEAQWRVSAFCRRTPDRPFTRKSVMRSNFSCFGIEHAYLEVRAVSDAEFRGTIANEQLPTWTERVTDGITAYGMDAMGAIAYVGAKATLISRGIAPPEVAAESWGRAEHPSGFGSGPVVWNCYDRPDGRCLFLDYVATREQVARERADKGKYPYESGSKMLAAWANTTEVVVNSCRAQFARVETIGGKVFTVTRDSLESVEGAIDDLIDAIRCAQVIEREANPAGPELRARASNAHADTGFRAFLAQLSAGNAPRA